MTEPLCLFRIFGYPAARTTGADGQELWGEHAHAGGQDPRPGLAQGCGPLKENDRSGARTTRVLARSRLCIHSVLGVLAAGVGEACVRKGPGFYS